MTVQEIQTAVMSLDSPADLNAVTSAIKVRRGQLAEVSARQFKFGDAAEFDGPYKQVLKGTVTKVNIKTVIVDVPEGRSGMPETWKVRATNLRLVNGGI